MLYTRYRTSPDGPIIRVRLAQSADRAPIAALLRRRGGDVDHELRARRLVRYDPRRELTLCATAWDGGHETIVGVAGLALDDTARPDLVVVDDPGAGVTEALHAAALARRPGPLHAAG